MNELPRCRLCLVPYGVPHPRTCPLWDVLLSEADWRRLHGPRLCARDLAILRRLASYGDATLYGSERAAIRAALGDDAQ